MTKPMLIEALNKPGMRALVRRAAVVIRTELEIIDEVSGNAIDIIDTLTTTDYEIIRDDPKPWVASDGDT
jgi:hypothetical protein